eukprot:TRINITY_DN10928_c0_g1_i2.p1 TRINITY_DN10928_c0_g1~~TRINITY_DN10928_c0_g1_i2.p1  ORF type:complete len:135 (+),score=37.83 TRINITY_DN10928_c0_g1_i2:194-598(+)
MSFQDNNAYASVDHMGRQKTDSEVEAQLMSDQLQVPAAQLQQRNDNILTIERDLEEIAGVVQDVAVLVDNDRTKVAAIDQHLDDTTNNTGAGNENLRKAVSGRNWKQSCCCAILGLLSIFNTVCIIIIIKRQSK